MHRNTDGARLVGNRAGNCLADPPGRVSGELEAFCIVKLFDRLDEAQITLPGSSPETAFRGRHSAWQWRQPGAGWPRARRFFAASVSLLSIRRGQLDLFVRLQTGRPCRFPFKYIRTGSSIANVPRPCADVSASSSSGISSTLPVEISVRHLSRAGRIAKSLVFTAMSMPSLFQRLIELVDLLAVQAPSRQAHPRFPSCVSLPFFFAQLESDPCSTLFFCHCFAVSAISYILPNLFLSLTAC